VQTLTTKQLALDASVWNLDSATFNPPNLIGTVSERTALEAMIQHNDNTGTDMSLKPAGPENVRRFIASAQLNNTVIPDSTRSLFGYLLGAMDYKTFSWMQLIAATNSPMVNSPMNKEQTMAASAADFVSYYSRALQGGFFKNKETLNEYRRILSLGDPIWILPQPLGGSAFCKGGSIDVPRISRGVRTGQNGLRGSLGVLCVYHQLASSGGNRPSDSSGVCENGGPGDDDREGRVDHLAWRQPPAAGQLRISRRRQLYQQWLMRWINPGEQGCQFVLRHSRASGRTSRGTAPNVEKDARSAAAYRRRRITHVTAIVTDYDPPPVGFAHTAHVL
jgi:Beta-lactamase enzyme family